MTLGVALLVAIAPSYAGALDDYIKYPGPEIVRGMMATTSASAIFTSIHTNPGAADATYFDLAAHHAPWLQGQPADVARVSPARVFVEIDTDDEEGTT